MLKFWLQFQFPICVTISSVSKTTWSTLRYEGVSVGARDHACSHQVCVLWIRISVWKVALCNFQTPSGAHTDFINFTLLFSSALEQLPDHLLAPLNSKWKCYSLLQLKGHRLLHHHISNLSLPFSLLNIEIENATILAALFPHGANHTFKATAAFLRKEKMVKSQTEQ